MHRTDLPSATLMDLTLGGVLLSSTGTSRSISDANRTYAFNVDFNTTDKIYINRENAFKTVLFG